MAATPPPENSPDRPPGQTPAIPGSRFWATATPRTRIAVVGGVLVGVAALILLVPMLGGPSRPSGTPAAVGPTAGTASPAAGAPVPGAPGGGDTQVGVLNGCPLLSDAEVEEAMGLLDIPWVERILIEFSGGEACTWIHERNGVDVEGLSVRIGPGAVEDFQPGARLEGISGERVPGVGQLAVWFGGDRQGTLSVTAESGLGQVFARVTVARPDLQAPDILPLARDLAVAALPRFPGMGATVPESQKVVVEPGPPPDVSNLSWVDNLLARETAGEWTRGEGLVASLRAFAGELGAGEVLRRPDLIDGSGTGLLDMAQAYLESGPDAVAKAEIGRLLDILVLTRSDIEALMAGGQPRIVLAAYRPPGPLQTEDVFGLCPKSESPCLNEYESPVLDGLNQRYGPGSFRVLFPSYWGTPTFSKEAGWTDDDLTWIAEAMRDSARVYVPLTPSGRLPPVDVLVTPYGVPLVSTHALRDGCTIAVNRGMQAQFEAPFKQRIAQQMAFCLFAVALEGEYEGSGSASWWPDAFAWHLSNSVYPAPRCRDKRAGQESPAPAYRCDLEWFGLPQELANQELSTDLFQRKASNALFFQHLWWELKDDENVMQFARSMPIGVDRYEDIPRIFHEFAKKLTNSSSDIRGGIGDTGGQTVPLDPRATDIALSDDTSYAVSLIPFRTARLLLEVASGSKACVVYDAPGSIMSSWRPGYEGAAGNEGQWRDRVPAELTGESVLVITTTSSVQPPILTVNDIVPEDRDCTPASPPPSPCSPQICGPSEYFRSLTNLPRWFFGEVP